MSFRFSSSNILTQCTDLRTPALAFNILVSCLLFLILRPTAITVWWCLVCIGFWHIALFSQPQAVPPPLDVAFGAFLPTLFVCYAFWRVAVRFTLPVFTNAPFEAMIWYLAPYWTGVLTNLTMDQIPIDRLTAADIKQQPGGVTALIIIVLVLLVLVINQVRVIRKTGWLPYYLGWYILGGLVTLVLALLPGLEFRLHHYIISMVLFPGTGFPTRLSAIYQGFLLGMFLNDVAAFGFDPILQTAAAVRHLALYVCSLLLIYVYCSWSEMAQLAPLFPLSSRTPPPTTSPSLSRTKPLPGPTSQPTLPTKAGMSLHCWWMMWRCM